MILIFKIETARAMSQMLRPCLSPAFNLGSRPLIAWLQRLLSQKTSKTGYRAQSGCHHHSLMVICKWRFVTVQLFFCRSCSAKCCNLKGQCVSYSCILGQESILQTNEHLYFYHISCHVHVHLSYTSYDVMINYKIQSRSTFFFVFSDFIYLKNTCILYSILCQPVKVAHFEELFLKTFPSCPFCPQ